MNVEQINDTRKKITISFGAEDFSKEREKVAAEFVKSAKVQGFRPGKAPREMIETLYGKSIDTEVEKSLTNKAVQELNGIKDFDIFSVVDLNRTENDGIRALEFTVDVYPEVKLPESLATTVELGSDDASDEEVEQGVKYHLNQRAKYEVVERPIAKGDFVRLNYSGSIDGKKISEILENQPMFGDQNGTWEEAGNADVPGVQGVVQGIVGMSKDEKKVVKHKFPKDFEVKELAGKEADYDVEILEVREKIMPEINEEFLKSFEAKDEADFREKIKESISREKKSNNEILKRQYAVEQLMGKCDFPIPQSATDEERQMILEEMMTRFMSSGASREDMESRKDELFEMADKEAAGRAKMRIFLNRVAKANELKIDNEDMSRMLWQEAMRTRTKPEDLIKHLRKDPERQNKMRSDALLQKSINFIAEKAEVKIKA